MRIRTVTPNNHRKAFEVSLPSGTLAFPYAKASPPPTARDRIVECAVDPELGREGFTYRLQSGHEGSIHVEQVLEYNQDPRYLRDLMLHELKVAALRCLKTTALSKREITRRLGTSATQFYRLLDPTNTRTSVDQLLALLHILECDVRLVIRPKPMPRRPRAA